MINIRDFYNQVKEQPPFNYTIKNDQDKDEAVIDVYGYIGRDILSELIEGETSQNTAKSFRQKLKEIEAGTIVVNINSLGGDMNEGLVIKDLLEQHSARIVTNLYGFSASAATIIHQAGDVRRMTSNSSFMLIHRTMLGVCDYVNLNTILAMAEDLETIDNQLVNMYVSRSSSSDKEIRDLMDAGEGYGKWITGEKAMEMGLIDELFSSKKDDDEKEEKYTNELITDESVALAIRNGVISDNTPDIINEETSKEDNVTASKLRRERELTIIKHRQSC